MMNNVVSTHPTNRNFQTKRKMTDNQNHPTPKPLSDAIALLERSLGSPQVPGELPSWLHTVDKSFRQAAPLFREHLTRTHEQQFEDILKEDAELSQRVIRLKAIDAQLLAEFKSLRDEFDKLQARCQAADKNHAKPLYDAAAKRADRGLEFVIAFRKQEAALATWFVEAFQRDRGTAD